MSYAPTYQAWNSEPRAGAAVAWRANSMELCGDLQPGHSCPSSPPAPVSQCLWIEVVAGSGAPAGAS